MVSLSPVTAVLLLLAATPIKQAVPAPDWDAAFNQTQGWIGGDAIYSCPLPDDQVLWLFADTFIGSVKDGQRQPALKMVNNTLARHRLPTLGDAPAPNDVQFLWSRPEGTDPAAWIRPDQPDRSKEWYWVADAITAPGPEGGERLLVFLWRMAHAGQSGVFNFKSAGTNLAIIDNPKDDWSKWQPRQVDVTHDSGSSPKESPLPEIVWGSELLLEEMDGARYLVVFGYRSRKAWGNELLAARVQPEHAEDMAAWEFRTAEGWSREIGAAASLAEGLTTEFSISKVEAPQGPRWVMVHSELFFGHHILMRSSATPFGPWSKPQQVYLIPDIDSEKKHFTYAAKAHPELSPPGKLLVSYVVNSFDFGEACRNAGIYRPRFVWLPIE